MKYLSKLVWEILPKLTLVVKVMSSLAFFSVLWMSANVSAATFIVDTTIDSTDSNPGDGFCSSLTGGQCSLRAAIQEANALSGDDTIILSTATYSLSEVGVDEDMATTGDLDIFGSGAVIIRGVSAAETIIDGNGIDRVIHILDTAGKVILEQLMVRGGTLIGNGAGIFNAGADTLIRSVEVSDNFAEIDFDGGETSFGVAGGIYNEISASLIVDQSYIAFNNSRNREYFDRITQLLAGGGGIYNAGTLEVRNNSRIEDNLAQQGGGILNTGLAYVNDSIVAFNNSKFAGGGIFNWGGVLNVRRSIISDNSCGGPPCEGGGISNQPGTNQFDGGTVVGTGSNQFNGASGVAVIIGSQIENNSGVLNIGSGISNNSQMYIAYSSVSWNRGSGIGAGISNQGLGDLTIENSAIVGNHASVLGMHGNGIHTTSRLRLDQVTMTGNFSGAPTLAQELYINTDDFDETDPMSWVTIKNSIIGDDAYRRKLEKRPEVHASGATNDNYCGGGYSDEPDGTPLGSVAGEVVFTNDYLSLIRSEGYNLTNGFSCGLAGTNDLPNVAPDLLDAGDYGGVLLPIGPFLPRVLSRPPANTSSAINAIPQTHCTILFDQRLLGRSTTGACDIGSIEVGATDVPYADLQLTATADRQQVNFGDDITYTVVIKNWGKDAAIDLSGSAEPSNGVGQPTKPLVMSTFKFLNLSVTGASFSAPDPSGTVSCQIFTTTEDEEQTQCSYDRPLLPGTELIINLRVAPRGFGWSLSNTAEVDVRNPLDPISYNNKVTLRRVTGIGTDGTWQTPEETRPVETTGALSVSRFEISLLTALLLFILLKRWLVVKTIKRSQALTMIAGAVFFLMVQSALAAVPEITGISPGVGSSSLPTTIIIEGNGFEADARVALLNDSDVSALSARAVFNARPFNRYLVKQNQYLYLALVYNASIYTLAVYDVSDPLSPILQSDSSIGYFLPPRLRQPPPSLSSRGSFSSLAVSANNRLYGFYSGRFGIFDFSDPASPNQEHEFRVFTRSDGLHPHFGSIDAMAVSGDLLYAYKSSARPSFSDQAGLHIIDTSKTTGVNIISFTQMLGAGSRFMELFSVPTAEGLKKYIALVGNYSSLEIKGVSRNGSLFIYDVTDPTNPIAVAAYEGPNDALIEDVAIKLVTTETGTKVYAIAATYRNFASGGGLAVYDISPDAGFNETLPVAFYDKLSNGRSVKLDRVNEDIAIFHGRGDTTLNPEIVPAFWEFDVSDPTAPKLVGGPYLFQSGPDDDPTWTPYWPQDRTTWDVDDGFIYSQEGAIYKTNPPLTNITITPTKITAVVPAGYRPQVFDVIVTNPLGGTEEARLIDSFTIE